MIEVCSEESQPIEASKSVLSRLHQYQLNGVVFLLQSSSALLADEMGLGKTVQAATALAAIMKKGVSRALIVAPASLLANWMRELAVWAPELTVWRVRGKQRDRQAFYELPIPILVASYEQIRQDALDRVPLGRFDLVILDEAQRIKNRASATSLACRLLPRKRAWALSATPLENNRDDILSLLDFLDPPVDTSMSDQGIASRLSSLMLRRRKSEVRSELPPILIQDLEVELTPDQRLHYDEIWTAGFNHISKSRQTNDTAALLGIITKLKTICNFDEDSSRSSKLDVLQTIIEGSGASARIIIFSQFVQTLKWLAVRTKLPHDMIIGSMAEDAKELALTNFQSGISPRLLFVSLRAGGVGLNLGAASHVVLFDRWWNPAVEQQAIYRGHRFERDEPLHVIRFIVLDSVEEKIDAIIKRKAEIFTELVEEASGQSSHRLTRDELLEILSINSSRSTNE